MDLEIDELEIKKGTVQIWLVMDMWQSMIPVEN